MMLFEPTLGSVLPEGLELFPALVDVPPGASKAVKIPVCNSTKHDIFLSPRTVLGCIEEIIDSRPVNLCPSSQPPVKSNSNTHVSTAQVGPAGDAVREPAAGVSGILPLLRPRLFSTGKAAV